MGLMLETNVLKASAMLIASLRGCSRGCGTMRGVGQYVVGRSESLFECAISGTYANSAVIPQHRPSASRRLWPARPAAICLPDACGLGCDSHGSKDFSGKLLEFLTQTGS